MDMKSCGKKQCSDFGECHHSIEGHHKTTVCDMSNNGKLCISKCRPQKKVVAHSTSHNTDYVTALWKELNKRQGWGVPEKSNWIPITKRRLNSAIKRLNCT